MDKLALVLLLVVASVLTETLGTAAVDSQRALSRVKRLDASEQPHADVSHGNHKKTEKSQPRASSVAMDTKESEDASSRSVVADVSVDAVVAENIKQSQANRQVSKHTPDQRRRKQYSFNGEKRGPLSPGHRHEIRVPHSPHPKLVHNDLASKTGRAEPRDTLSESKHFTAMRKKDSPSSHEHWWHRQRRLWQKRNAPTTKDKKAGGVHVKRKWREMRRNRENNQNKIHNRQPEHNKVTSKLQTHSASHLKNKKKFRQRKRVQINPEEEGKQEMALRDAARNFQHSHKSVPAGLTKLEKHKHDIKSRQEKVADVKKFKKHSTERKQNGESLNHSGDVTKPK